MKPTGWTNCTLGNVVTLQRGHDLPETMRRRGAVPILGSFGVTGYHDEPRAPSPGVTVGRSGASFGVVSYSPVPYWPLNTALYVNDFHGNDERFAYYFLKNLDFSSFNSGSAQPSLNRNHIHPMPVCIPELGEQRAIVGVLGALDDKIEQNRRTARALERLARAIFRAWFVDFEPVKAKAAGATAFPSMPQPVFDALPTRLVDSAIGPVPEGWHVSTVGACSNYLSRGIAPRYVDQGGVLVVNQKCIRDFTINLSKARRHDTRSKKIDGRELVVGDVLINSTGVGTLGRVAQLLRLPRGPVVVDSHVTVVRPSLDVGWPFLGQALMLSQSVIEAMGEGSTGQTELSRKKISDLRLVVPQSPVLSAFDEDVVPLMQLTSSLSEESQKLAELRDYLLPKLLSGAVRVKDAE